MANDTQGSRKVPPVFIDRRTGLWSSTCEKTRRKLRKLQKNPETVALWSVGGASAVLLTLQEND